MLGNAHDHNQPNRSKYQYDHKFTITNFSVEDISC